MTVSELMDRLVLLPSDAEVLLMPGHPCDTEYLMATSVECLPEKPESSPQVLISSFEYQYND